MTVHMTIDLKKIAKISDFELEATSIEEASNQIIERLAVYYARFQPERSFTNDVLKPLLNSASGVPAEISYQTFADADHTKRSLGTELKFLITACGFALQAETEEGEGHLDKAWRCIANAQYQMGVFEGLIIVEPALMHVISSRSKAGATTRNKQYEPLRIRVREIAAKGKNGKPFPSRRQAVLAVMKELDDLREELQVEMKSTYPIETIDKWLSDMTFGNNLS